MNRLFLAVALALAVAVAGALALVGSRPLRPNPQTIALVGSTNGWVGAVAPVFATLATNYAATYQRWLAGGTNDAVFRMTNHQNVAIWLYPIAWLVPTAAGRAAVETPVLNAPDFSGLRIGRGEVADVWVALPPQAGEWRLRLLYHRDQCSDTFLNRLRTLPASLRAGISGQPVTVTTYPIESEWVGRK